MKKWLKAVILTYLSLLFFGSFIAVGMLGTGALENPCHLFLILRSFCIIFCWSHWWIP